MSLCILYSSLRNAIIYNRRKRKNGCGGIYGKLKVRQYSSMKLCMNDLLYAISGALDYVEQEYLGATDAHSLRVATLSVMTGKRLGLEETRLLQLAGCAVLHDNALTEYGLLETKAGNVSHDREGLKSVGDHCRIGEKNVEALPLYANCRGVILCHHENADGSGPFGYRTQDTPLLARLIHMADVVDIQFRLKQQDTEKRSQVRTFVGSHRGSFFDEEVTDAFLDVLDTGEILQAAGDHVMETLRGMLPVIVRDYGDDEILRIAEMFARIVDFKSESTSRHSLGVARKAAAMGAYYGYPKETQTKLYLTGALHDIGKLAVPSAILEKPGSLSTQEFEEIKKHAVVSYEVLSRIEGIDEMRDWAAYHHEKLDGSGYPFGKKGYELNHMERMMACIDIYQALTEPRSYKAPFTHAKAMEMMRDMAVEGKIDPSITADLDRCFGAQTAACRR